MAKTLNFIVPLVVYPFDIMFSFGETDEELHPHLFERGINLDDEGDCWKYPSEQALGRTCMLSTNQTIVRVRNIPKTPQDYGVLAHEIFHAVDFVLYRIRIRLSRKSDEAYAYLIEYVTEKVFEHLKGNK